MSKVVDNYVILDEIGSGQFSSVHKGRHMMSGESVAIKILKLNKLENNPAIRELIDEEVSALRQIDSPYVIKNIKMLKTANNIYEIYEFCENGNLFSLLQKRGKLGEKEALLIFRDLVMAIRALYQKSTVGLSGIMHRDIKPENIFLKVERAILGDFGFCKILANANELTSGAFGSPMYMAPEVLTGKSYGMSSDLYSLGIVLYEMIYGSVPYDATSIDDLLLQIKEKGPQFHKKKISKKLETLIMSLLEANPQMRISHSSLFEVVLKDPNFPNSLLETGDSLLSSSLSKATRKSVGEATEDTLINDFVKDILFERSKYTFLIELASKATLFKQ